MLIVDARETLRDRRAMAARAGGSSPDQPALRGPACLLAQKVHYSLRQDACKLLVVVSLDGEKLVVHSKDGKDVKPPT